MTKVGTGIEGEFWVSAGPPDVDLQARCCQDSALLLCFTALLCGCIYGLLLVEFSPRFQGLATPKSLSCCCLIPLASLISQKMLEEGPVSTSPNRVWMSFGWGLGTPATRPRGRSPRGLRRALGFLRKGRIQSGPVKVGKRSLEATIPARGSRWWLPCQSDPPR